MKKNKVKYLQSINFSQLALAETTEIRNLVCLTPDLVISQSSLNRIQTYVRKCIPAIHDKKRGMRWRIWLRLCATSRKVAGSIPNDVIEFFIDILPAGLWAWVRLSL